MTTRQLSGLEAYEILEQKKIAELNSEGYVMRHKKSGARLFLLSNDDENKVFSIGFRTPPEDSTGVAHILEHSTLCGSEKFPVKDPFVELVKGSLNTFLNAMTYPDKTVYPVASCNEKDFQNLMDVYLDSVFHPNIYQEPRIFMQEGWHYELEKEDDPLIYNGVVYNEMKGAFSSPEEALDRCTRAALFPDNCYGCESGGDPECIPDLTYEQFLDFHRKYYHPSNSYIYLYGDMDMAGKLDFIDREYLSRYEFLPVDSEIHLQAPFDSPKEAEISYSVTEEEPEEGASYLSVNTVTGTALDRKLYLAFQILGYTLIDAPGAPLKQELLDAGVGQDILGGYENGVLQPYFSVIAKNADPEQRGEFLTIVKGTLRKLADQGINKKSLRAGINYYEFYCREGDYGSAPKGLMYGLQSMESWLYGGDPAMHLEYEETFEFLKKAVDEGYFENLIREYLLDNPFEAVIVVKPERNLTEKKEEETAKKLAAYKASLSQEEIKRLVSETEKLREYQEAPTPQEELKKIPMLRREDIGREPEELFCKEQEIDGIPVLHHEMFTSGIGYLKILFDTSAVPVEDLPYVGLLKSVLGYVNTSKHTYGDLTSEIHLNSGGVNLSVTAYPDFRRPGEFTGMFVVSAKALYEKLDFAFSIISEILTESILDDEKRLGEILGETKSRSRMRLENSCHVAAIARALSYSSPMGYFNDLTGGIGYYRFLETTAKEYEQDKKRLIEKLKETAARLFTKGNMTVSYTADQEGFGRLAGDMKLLAENLGEGSAERFKLREPAEKKNEGFKTSSQVNYVARCGSFAPDEYTGVLKILKVILNYDYLWINLRVKGGAYGCMSGFGRTGESYFVSYRDPNLKETNRIYEEMADYLENFQVDERDMTKYVIGTISDMDTPLPPSSKGVRSLSAYLSGLDREMLKKEREQVLNAAPEDIRSLSGLIREILSAGNLCAIGNGEKIEAASEMFGEVKNLFG